jgi:fluoride ion exporter CrcB/FEX
MLREFSMLMVPNLADNFPLDILVANLVAAFLLGLVTALHRRQIVSEGAEMLVSTGIAGGLSTFSSFVYGAVVLMSASTASAVVASGLHRSHCRAEAQRTKLSMNRSPAGEETLVFIAYMRVSKADGSQVVDLRPDALAVTGVAADQLDLDRGSGKRDDWPGFPFRRRRLACGHPVPACGSRRRV